MDYKCTMCLKGHIIDSLILSKVFDAIWELGAKCKAVEIVLGEERTDTSLAKFLIEAENETIFNEAVAIAQKHGATSC
mgnify:CR=1 FL=1